MNRGEALEPLLNLRLNAIRGNHVKLRVGSSEIALVARFQSGQWSVTFPSFFAECDVLALFPAN